MTPEHTQTFAPDQRLRAILTDYQQAVAAGKAPSREELLAQHPDLAEQLRQALPAVESSAWEVVTGAATPNLSQPVGAVTPSQGDPAVQPTLSPEQPLPTALLFHRDFGDYELLSEIARGGMGVVFKARQKSLNRIVALKMILAGHLASPEQVRRFHVEAEEAGNLDHPNIVPIYQVGEEQGQHYFTMKLIEGGTLTAQIARFQADPRGAAHLVARVAGAVQYAHQHGILHRDLKPGNILMDAEGQPHVTDFGLAKHLGGPTGDTQSGCVLGTPAYMAPEQAEACKNLSTAVDVYSLGAILYELLTGRPPFQAANPVDILLKVLEKEPDPPHKLNPRVDRDLETICLTCLAKDPQRRYPSARQLVNDLERYLADEPIQARPVSVMEKARKWARRRPAAAALVGVSALAVVILSVGSWLYNVRLHAAFQEADQQRQAAEDNAVALQAALQEADLQRQAAETNAAAVKANYKKRQEVVDNVLVRIDGRLANEPAMESVRVEFLEEFLQLSQQLLQEQPKDRTIRHQTALIHRRIGEVMLNRQRYQRGSEAYVQALKLQEQLVAEFPNDRSYRDELAQAYAGQGKILEGRKKGAEAQVAFRKVIELEDQLAIEEPSQLDYRDRAARYRTELANLLAQAGQEPKALELYRQALELQEKIVTESPKRVNSHYFLAQTAQSLGLHLAHTNAAEGQRYLERGLAAMRQSYRLTGGSPGYGIVLRQNNYKTVQEFFMQQGSHQGLARLAEELRRDFPQSNGDTYNAACYLGNAAQVVVKDAKLADAERQRLADDYCRQAVALLGQSFQEGYRDLAHMDTDRDLDLLRKRDDYKTLVAEQERRFPSQKMTPAREYEAMARAYESEQSTYQLGRLTARTSAQNKKVSRRAAPFFDYAPRFLEFAQKNAESPAAIDALVWVLENAALVDKDQADKVAPLREKCVKLLTSHHITKPEFANVCQNLADKPQPDVEELLRTAIEKNVEQDVRGLASYALALCLAEQAERAQVRDPAKAAQLSRRAEEELQHVQDSYAAVPFGEKGSTLGEEARLKLYELRYLTVGRPAAEIEGKDFEGKSFKLSDYKGQVVFLDFWANWCGYCRQMYPQERELVQRHKDRPFALLGVNCDEDKDEVKREIDKQHLNWRSWWDRGSGGDRIAKKWQIHSFPRTFVLDHKGIIRYKDIRGGELDDAIEKLLKEWEAEQGKSTPK